MAEQIGILRARNGNELETEALCLKHGARSVVRPRDCVLTTEDAQDGDLLVDGVSCDLCGAWIIPPDPGAAESERQREAVPTEQRATHPLWN